MLISTIQKIIWDITPHIHNLPQVIYIQCLGYEWFVPKDSYWNNMN